MSPQDLHLYHREGPYIPRVAAVHDLCGYGTCSLGVAMPVLSAAGCDVCAVPTSLFSAHTRFPTYYQLDTTDMLGSYLDAWVAEGVELDAVYSGFLGAPAQVTSIRRLYDEHPHALRFVDPVMGDAGSMYATYTDELCEAMRGLVAGADVLTPNLTEASILTGIPYQGRDVSEDFVRHLVDALVGLGARTVVVKGVVRAGDSVIRTYVGGEGVDFAEVCEELLPFMLHGTGDLFASALLAAIMCGRSLLDATAFAARLVRDAMRVTRLQPDYELRGVSFETCLGEVTSLVAHP